MNYHFTEFIFQELQQFININNLLCSTIQFKEYKKKLFYWKLNKTHSILYYYDNDFYKYLNSIILYRNKQLSISLDGYKSIKNVQRLGNVHTLNLSYCDNLTDVSCLGNVHSLNLSFCYKITDISFLGNVHTLNLTGCDKITDISSLCNVNIIS